VGRRHPDVGDHGVRALLLDGGDQGFGVADRGDHIQAAVAKELHQALADDGRVLGDDDPQRCGGRHAVSPGSEIHRASVRTSESASDPLRGTAVRR
jgi:hypothetical protein